MMEGAGALPLIHPLSHGEQFHARGLVLVTNRLVMAISDRGPSAGGHSGHGTGGTSELPGFPDRFEATVFKGAAQAALDLETLQHLISHGAVEEFPMGSTGLLGPVAVSASRSRVSALCWDAPGGVTAIPMHAVMRCSTPSIVVGSATFSRR